MELANDLSGLFVAVKVCGLAVVSVPFIVGLLKLAAR